MNKFEDFKYTILKVKTVSFQVNEDAYIPGAGKEIRLQMSHLFGVSIETGIIDFRLKTFFHYSETPQQKLSDIEVQNLFKVEELQKYFKNNTITLPQEVIISIISLSISHSRALLSQNLAGTVFQDFIMPITNPFYVAKIFYPSMFDKETGEVKIEVPLIVNLKNKKDKKG